MPDQIKTKKSLLKVYNSCSSGVQRYFEHLPKLLDEFPLNVALAYAFSRLELAQNMALYCGVVKVTPRRRGACKPSSQHSSHDT